ncbi:MAG: ribonuclease III [Candidatus Fervidibacter sp.]|uniref:ribonuclease III n=1 Tax=Candidatus Fervidibacter sp. TaxID=3100871 RepID=UPI00404A4952
MGERQTKAKKQPVKLVHRRNKTVIQLSSERREALLRLCEQLKVKFRRLDLLNTALTHPSYCAEFNQGNLPSNQRLEFLGDAVLALVVSEYLYQTYPEMDEGQLTRIKAISVSEPVLHSVSKKLGVGQYLLLGKGEERTGGRDRPSVLADAFEALVGAMFLDKGLRTTTEFVLKHLKRRIKMIERDRLILDFKSRLQELTQSRYHLVPTYHLIQTIGPDHAKTFVSEVRLQGITIGRGRGHSKKEAEQEAARAALRKLLKSNFQLP